MDKNGNDLNPWDDGYEPLEITAVNFILNHIWAMSRPSFLPADVPKDRWGVVMRDQLDCWFEEWKQIDDEPGWLEREGEKLEEWEASVEFLVQRGSLIVWPPKVPYTGGS